MVCGRGIYYKLRLILAARIREASYIFLFLFKYSIKVYILLAFNIKQWGRTETRHGQYVGARSFPKFRKNIQIGRKNKGVFFKPNRRMDFFPSVQYNKPLSQKIQTGRNKAQPVRRSTVLS